MRKLISGGKSLLLRTRYTYIPVSNYEVQKKQNPVVEVTLRGPAGRELEIHFRLFENTVPRTAENFRRLLLGTASYQGRGLSLLNTAFHQQVPRAYAELGHLPGGNSSIFGPTFRDESFELPHDRPGLLSCVSEENTCNSRFLITYAPCPFLDLKNVVFGEVTAETLHHLRTLERLGDAITQYSIHATRQAEIKEEHHHDHAHAHAHGH